MHLAKRMTISSILATLIILSACKHKAEIAPGCIAGPGGKMAVILFAVHDSTFLLNFPGHPDTAFVKFGTTSSPGTHPKDYDSFFIGDPGEDHIHCIGLKCGEYYFYRTAWDSAAHVSRYGGYGLILPDSAGFRLINVTVK